jgi:hypothetical protein
MTALVSPPKYRLNKQPRLSANQLADYLNASSTRRKRILQDAKFPRTVIVARYDGARSGITNFLCDIARPTGTLIDAIVEMNDKAQKNESAWVKQDSLLSVEAIESFHTAYTANKLAVRKIECRKIQGTLPPLMIEGTKVSVAVDSTTHRKGKDGTDQVGGVILLFSKSETSSAARVERCRMAAVLALLFAQQHLKMYGEADPKICFAIDVFGGGAQIAPGSYKQRLNNIVTGCEEVKDRWPNIEPPADYDGPEWKQKRGDRVESRRVQSLFLTAIPKRATARLPLCPSTKGFAEEA